MAENAKPTTPPMPEGFNLEQCRAVLETIACRASTLCDLIRKVQQNDPGMDWETSAALNASLYIAESLGAMADHAVPPGGGVIGDFERWFYGAGFSDLGKEASHG